VELGYWRPDQVEEFNRQASRVLARGVALGVLPPQTAASLRFYPEFETVGLRLGRVLAHLVDLHDPVYAGRVHPVDRGSSSAVVSQQLAWIDPKFYPAPLAAGELRRIARQPGPSILFNGHVDVVPANASKWSRDPFSGLVTDTDVHGRGATDDKGGVVAAAFAALALKRAGVKLKGDVVLQAVVGEETGDHQYGTSAALDAGYTADAAVIVEPTSYDGTTPKLATVSAGGLWFSLSFEGKAAHSSLRGRALHPTLDGETLGVNTVDKFWVVYQALRNLEDQWAQHDRHPHYVPGHFSILPAVLDAHPTGFKVPFALADTLTVEYSVTHNPARTNEDVIAEIEHAVRSACALDPWLREHTPIFEWKLLWAPYTLSPDHPLLPALTSAHSAALGAIDESRLPELSGFFGLCDITWMDARGLQGVMYGPGVGNTAHAEDEYVPIEQLVVAAKTYALTALAFCGLAEVGTS